MSKQTAVEWFFSELERMQYFIGNDMLEAYKQAKEMDKEQKREMFVCGGRYQLTGGGIFTQVHEELYGGTNE